MLHQTPKNYGSLGYDKRSPQKKATVTKFKGAHLLKWLTTFCVLDGVAASEFDAIASPRTPRVLGWMTPPSSPPAPPTPPTSPPASPPLASVDLGTAEGFALLAKSGITTTGATEVTALSLSLPLARAPTPNPSPYPLPPTPYPYTPTPIPLYP